MKEIVLVVWMFSASPEGNLVKERHEYPFPSVATCEKAQAAVMADWRAVKANWHPHGIAAWCKQ